MLCISEQRKREGRRREAGRQEEVARKAEKLKDVVRKERKRKWMLEEERGGVFHPVCFTSGLLNLKRG